MPIQHFEIKVKDFIKALNEYADKDYKISIQEIVNLFNDEYKRRIEK